MTDGARNALLGYLYQFSLVASLRAYHAGTTEVEKGWPSLLGHVAGGRLTSERFNQDAVVEDGNSGSKECLAVQIKYTDDPNQQMDLQSFIEVLYGFDQSRMLAAADGWSIGKFYIITNRLLNSAVAGLWERRDEAGLRRMVSSKKRDGEYPEWLKKVFKPYNNDEAEALARWCEVLVRLEPLLQASHELGLRRLQGFAFRHGMIPREWEKALKDLYGALISDTIGTKPVVITTEWLKTHLLGAPDVRQVVFGPASEIVDAARELLTRRLSAIAGPTERALSRRRIEVELADKVRNHTVTFVCGMGGTGKSVIAVQYLLGADHTGLGISLESSAASNLHLAELLRRLRSRSYSTRLPSDSLDEAIGRLQHASVTTGVAVVVDLDALDEIHPNTRESVKEVVKHFFQQDAGAYGARLVASCRLRSQARSGHLNIVRDWLDVEYPEYVIDRVGIVEVSDFEEEELFEAARRLNTGPESVLLAATAYATREHSGGETSREAEVESLPAIAESLRHPVVWGAYASLSDKERHSVLSGGGNGTVRLTNALLMRFLRKCSKRINNHIMESHLEAALRHVAATTSVTPPPYGRVDTWDLACQQVLGTSQRDFLYNEALTYGLIQEDEPAKWRWRHTFVQTALVGGAS